MAWPTSDGNCILDHRPPLPRTVIWPRSQSTSSSSKLPVWQAASGRRNRAARGQHQWSAGGFSQLHPVAEISELWKANKHDREGVNAAANRIGCKLTGITPYSGMWCARPGPVSAIRQLSRIGPGKSASVSLPRADDAPLGSRAACAPRHVHASSQHPLAPALRFSTEIRTSSPPVREFSEKISPPLNHLPPDPRSPRPSVC